MRKMLCVVVTSMGILFANCNSPVFTPIASPNPWQDDYSFVLYGQLPLVGNLQCA